MRHSRSSDRFVTGASFVVRTPMQMAINAICRKCGQPFCYIPIENEKGCRLRHYCSRKCSGAAYISNGVERRKQRIALAEGVRLRKKLNVTAPETFEPPKKNKGRHRVHLKSPWSL